METARLNGSCRASIAPDSKRSQARCFALLLLAVPGDSPEMMARTSLGDERQPHFLRMTKPGRTQQQLRGIAVSVFRMSAFSRVVRMGRPLSRADSWPAFSKEYSRDGTLQCSRGFANARQSLCLRDGCVLVPEFHFPEVWLSDNRERLSEARRLPHAGIAEMRRVEPRTHLRQQEKSPELTRGTPQRAVRTHGHP